MSTMESSNSAPKKLRRAEIVRQALEYRKAGMTYDEIGRRLGFSTQRAGKIVNEELKRINKKSAEDAQEITTLEMLRLDAMLQGIWKSATEEGSLGAVDRVLAIMNRRAKMLGLDEVSKSTVTALQNINLNMNGAKELTDAERAQAIQNILARIGQDSNGSKLLEGMVVNDSNVLASTDDGYTERTSQASQLPEVGQGGDRQDTEGEGKPTGRILGSPGDATDPVRDGSGSVADSITPLDL